MMTLQEAIEEIEKATVGCYPWTALDIAGGDPDKVAHEDHAIATILNAVIDGTLIPADAVFQVREGYEVTARHKYSETYVMPETALTIRSAEEVRREALEEAAERLKHEKKIAPNLGYYDAVDWILSLIDAPQPKGGDYE